VGKSKNPVATGKILILKELQGKYGYFNPISPSDISALLKGMGASARRGSNIIISNIRRVA